MIKFIFALLIFFLSSFPVENSGKTVKEPLPVYTYFIVNSIPHDHNAFTQGLVYHNGYLYESTGRRGTSSLRKVDITNGGIIQIYNLPEQYFAEGITVFDKRIIQLTWQSYTGFVYDLESLHVLEEFYYNSEGWGLTHDGTSLIMSDGTATLYFLDPKTFAIQNEIQVFDHKGPVINLNELEYVQGEIFANIFASNRIARIDPGSGKVLAWIDLSGMQKLASQKYAVDVLNGIAYDDEQDRLYITGKLWPRVYEIRLIKKAQD
jgi:glutamine cyclotransferase